MNRNSIFLICFIIFYLILFNILNYVKIKIKSLKGITMTNKLNKLDIVEKQKLTFAYPGSDNIFEDISFSIDTNWKIGLIGKNGIRKKYIV